MPTFADRGCRVVSATDIALNFPILSSIFQYGPYSLLADNITLYLKMGMWTKFM
jgi:hypothetical protein